MKVEEVDVVQKTKIYTLTEEELQDFKCKERAYGSRKTREYIGFCYNNYIWKRNIGGVVNFINDVLSFLEYKNDGIPNSYNWSLFEWLEQDRK